MPADIPALVAEVEREQQVFVVLDSLYNFLGGANMKDEEVGAVLSRIKRDVCDVTGATVCVIDHAPWPTESNRGQRRAYGSVFKAAAIRWGVYIDREGGKLYVEARGNNVVGFARSLAYWAGDDRELRLIDTQRVDDEERDERMLTYLDEHADWVSGRTAAKEVKGRESDNRKSLRRLETAGRVTSARPKDVGRTGTGLLWKRASEDDSERGRLFGPHPAAPGPECDTSSGVRPPRPTP